MASHNSRPPRATADGWAGMGGHQKRQGQRGSLRDPPVGATLGGQEALMRAAEHWGGSPPKGVDREVAGTLLESKSATGVTIQTANGTRQTFGVWPFVQGTLSQIPKDQSVTLLIDNENKVMDVAFPSR